MNIKPATITISRLFLVAAAAMGMLLIVFMTPIFGQKEQAERATTRDGLTATGFMTNPEVLDDLDGTDDEYFYKFVAGPGKLTVILEVVANETNAGATLDLFGMNSRAILSNMLAQGVDGGSERVTKSVNLAKTQEIVIRIKALKYGSSGGYPGTYKVLLQGPAANFQVAAPVDVTVPEKTPVLTPIDGADQNVPDLSQSDLTGQENKAAEAVTDKTEANIKPDVPPSDATVEGKKPAAAPSDSTGQNKKPDAVDRAIEKGRAKGQKVLNVLEKVKAKIPD